METKTLLKYIIVSAIIIGVATPFVMQSSLLKSLSKKKVSSKEKIDAAMAQFGKNAKYVEARGDMPAIIEGDVHKLSSDMFLTNLSREGLIWGASSKALLHCVEDCKDSQEPYMEVTTIFDMGRNILGMEKHHTLVIECPIFNPSNNLSLLKIKTVDGEYYDSPNFQNDDIKYREEFVK